MNFVKKLLSLFSFVYTKLENPCVFLLYRVFTSIYYDNRGEDMRATDALVQMLEKAGVHTIFGVCGDTTLPFYESLYLGRSSINHVLTRDERSASFMADAYARISGNVGVCEGPSGGGVTYIIPGVAEANQSSVPVLAINTDIHNRHRGRGTLTELDQDAIFKPITKWTKTLSRGEELPGAVRQAFKRATTGSLGAVHLGLPLDVQESNVSDDDIHIDPGYSRYPADRVAPGPDAVRKSADMLLESRNPVIVAGAGVIRSGAWAELKTLVDLLGCPVATSISGKGALAETHPYALGVIGGNGGLAYRHEFVTKADLVFFIGCHAGSVTTDKWTLPSDGSTNVLQLDIDPDHIGINYHLRQGIEADAKLGLTAIVEEIEDRLGGRRSTKVDPEAITEKRRRQISEIRAFQSNAMPIRPERFVTELSRVLPEDAVILCDAGTPTPYLSAYLRLPRAGRWFVSPRAHGALGYALPATVGAFHALPKSKIIGLMGDASFAMSVGELETIVRLKLPIVLIVLSNSCYGWIKAGQKAHGYHYFGVDFSNTEHAQIAKAFGLKAVKVEDPKELNHVLRNAMFDDSPVLVEVVVQPLHLLKPPVSKWIA